MAQEFEYNMKLKQMDVDTYTKKEAQIEDRKDKRTKIQASQQSQMISSTSNRSGYLLILKTDHGSTL